MFGLVLFVVFLPVELLLGLKVKRKTISIHCTVGILFSNSIDCDVKIRKSACILIQTFFCQSTNTYSFFYWLYFYPDYFLSSTNSARKRNKIGNLCPSIDFSNFSCMFLNPNIFFNFNYNCSHLKDMRNLQEQFQKSILLPKTILTFHFFWVFFFSQ